MSEGTKEFFPEVQFKIEPDLGNGEARFAVDELRTGGVIYTGLEGAAYTITSALYLFFENAYAPYRGVFRQVGPDGIRVTLSVRGVREVMRFSAGEGTQVTVTVGESEIQDVLPARQAVRLDVCSPVEDTPCLTEGDLGVFGVEYTGTLGDSETTHVLGQNRTPGIYFLEDTRDSVGAVFRSVSGENLQVRLFVGQRMVEVETGTTNVVVRGDI